MNLKLLYIILGGFLFFNVFQIQAQDIDSDLILNLTFSNEVSDLTGNATPITSGMEAYGEDRDGNSTCSIEFTGQPDEFIEIPMNADNQLIQGDEFTVSLWFRMNNTDMGNYEVLFRKGDSHTSGFEMGVYDMNTPLIGDNTYNLGIWDNDWNSNPDLYNDTDNWHHFVMVLTSTSVKLYRDNVLRNTLDYTGTEFNIGTNIINYQLGEGFIGWLDDVRVYKRALTSDEVNMLYEMSGDCESSLGIQSQELNDVKLVQPSAKKLQLVNLPEGKYKAIIYDMTGKEVRSLSDISNNNNLIDLNSLAPANYILKLGGFGHQTSNFKFILR